MKNTEFTPEMQERVKAKIAEKYPYIEYKLASMSADVMENVIRVVRNVLGLKNTVSFKDAEEKALFYGTLQTVAYNVMMRATEMLEKTDGSMDYLSTAHFMSAVAYSVAWYLECARMPEAEFRAKIANSPEAKAGADIMKQYEAMEDGKDNV